MTIDLANQSILDFLDYYTDPQRSLDYALLLDGPWGVGKTHLMRNFLQVRESCGKKHLYVSLYGITSVTQIEEEFYRLLHPVLSSKGMRMAGVLLRGAAKGLLKLDFSNGAATESLTLSVPEVDLSEYFKGTAGRLLVFDDLDRCMMPISDVLGYINTFVEHDGMKVILIANQDEVVKRDDSFLQIKEKLIGQTLRVQSNVLSVFPEFLQQIAKEKPREFLAKHRDNVLNIHAQSSTNNLRILKQAMWDFERLAMEIPDEMWVNSEGMLKLLQLILSISMEVRSGRLRPEHLPKLAGTLWGRYLRKQRNEEPDVDELFEKRYVGISLADPIFKPDVLGKIIMEGLQDSALVIRTLNDSHYFAKPSSRPAWMRAYSVFQSDDSEYEDALAEVIRQFEQRAENNCYKLYHIFGILLFASEIGAISKTKRELLLDGKAYVDDLVKDGRIINSLEQSPLIDGSRSFAGYGYIQLHLPEFQEFVAYYSDAANKVAIQSYQEIAVSVLGKIEKDPTEFLYDLCVNDVRSSPYYDVPILAALPPSGFVRKILELLPDKQMTVFAMFKRRYETLDPGQRLASEKLWLAEIRRLLLEALATARPATRFRLDAMIKSDIDPFLATEVADTTDNAMIIGAN